jgi:hypothetical protein
LFVDLIGEIYVSYDHCCRLSNCSPGVPKESLLQHMYTFLNHKYGLKTLIIDAANSLIRALQLYSSEHVVAVFGAILKHTIEEQFRQTQQKTINTVQQLLTAQIKVNKQPI